MIDQGQFISALLEAVDGFLFLDLHNVYCHMMNFDISFEEILATLPLHRVKELHISGGSFRPIQFENKNIYCDSHDAAIPKDLFTLMEQHLPNFLHIDTLIFERMGNTFSSQYEADQFQEDFLNLKFLIKKASYEMHKR